MFANSLQYLLYYPEDLQPCFEHFYNQEFCLLISSVFGFIRPDT